MLKQVKLAIENLEVKNDRLYIRGNIYISDNKKLQLHLLQKHYNPFKQGYFGHKAMFQDM